MASGFLMDSGVVLLSSRRRQQHGQHVINGEGESKGDSSEDILFIHFTAHQAVVTARSKCGQAGYCECGAEANKVGARATEDMS
jgi:hypothetical protein